MRSKASPKSNSRPTAKKFDNLTKTTAGIMLGTLTTIPLVASVTPAGEVRSIAGYGQIPEKILAVSPAPMRTTASSCGKESNRPARKNSRRHGSPGRYQDAF